MLPWFILLSVGQISAICASVTLVGQEARAEERGAIIAMNGFFGALGIFLAFAIGGRLFDAYGPSAPFIMVGAVQAVLFVGAIMIRVAAPGAAGR
jgi:predicted MFS family arabinose efflux permease